jgi:ketosteroid isomerase-like protein
MKLITSLVGIVAINFVTSAFAQEEETASPAPEEKASTTVEETPTPAPEAKTATTPAVQPTAQKKEKPAAAPPQKPASSAATSGKKMSAEASLKDNENRWEAAIAQHDTAAVESMVAADFIGVTSRPGAKVQNRRGLLAEMKGDKDTYTSTKNEKLDVHMYGSGIAVVVGTAREKGTGKDGKAFDRTYRFTDTWLDRGGKWQCVASQASLVSQK